ncbi:hypothetical protein J5N97_027225 [Dioscorea zingiberensis]|uniref:Cysteine-rich receptor-like protein kinase 10 n=1 Tax=Dioscorea zingiberensis TaxID=325984 RepID=A0A9D5C4V1_9LILI|nr:hypothetical protein J5N97_027225 [Dioscorea zingiberensis]
MFIASLLLPVLEQTNNKETMPSYYLLLVLIFPCIPLALSDDRDPTHYCPFNSDSNYTSNSTFNANLNLLFTSLINNTPATGFYNDTRGNTPEKIYGLALCRGDVSSDECRNCMNSSVQGIIQKCPQQKSAIIWIDHCLLRYSNQNFFSSVDTSIKLILYNTANASQPERFNNLLGNLMNDLAVKAVASTRRFAMGSVNFTSFQPIYGMLMCTRDLSKSNCDQCLRSYIAYIPNMGSGYQQGGVLLGMSCYLRFEVYLFYNSSAITAETASTSPVPSPPDTSVTIPTQVSSVPGKSNRTAIIISAIGIPSIAAVVLLSVTYFCLCKRRARNRSARKKQDGGDHGQKLKSVESLLFDLATIEDATNNFSEANKLGEGGFGPVYKGVLHDGQQIAVKRLAGNSSQGLIELKNEVILVANLQHKNLVRLLGCCLEKQEKLLVYEYLPNTSLDKFLFDPLRCKQLDWRRRYNIIEGIGRGLLYLHEDSRLKIIHRDLKPSNILLDGDMNPKISDFGLAKLFEVDETQGNTSRVAGTYGYMAPEYVLHGLFSSKSDVYSYGVLVLEIVTGRKNFSSQALEDAPNLLSYVWQHWNGGTALELKDPTLDGDQLIRAEEVLRCIHIGLLCVHEDPKQRPSMATVVLMLNSYSTSLPAPSPSTYYFPRIVERFSQETGSSVNRVSITEMEPRD